MGSVPALLFCFCACAPLTAALHIEVVRGEGNNNQYGRPGESILVRVSDDAGKPVKGASVIFSTVATVPSEPYVDFGGNGTAAQAETDESGTAGGPPARAAGGNGPVEVAVVAGKDGETANATVHQMNLGFVAETGKGEPEIAKLPLPDGQRLTDSHGDRIVRLKVIDSAGKPVAGAKVLLYFPPHKSGQDSARTENVAVESRSDGTVSLALDPKKFRGIKAIRISAVANGVTSTRFFMIE